MMTRKDFMRTMGLATGGFLVGGRCVGPDISVGPSVNTVTGTFPAADMALTLPHEHIMCDFIGADKVNRERYDPVEVVQTMLPYVEEIRKLGVQTFIDCTPAYLARDPLVLKELSEKTGVRFITNAGFYKEPYLPKFVWEIPVEELAALWEREITEGIGDTGIRAGFVKIAVNPGPLIPVQRKIATAAAIVQKHTGVAVASHTGVGVPALEQLDIFESAGANPGKFIFVHAQGEEDMEFHYETARRGAWVEYDAISEQSAEKDLARIQLMADKGYDDRILLSQDRGWYNVGEPNGGTIRGYAFLIREFIPMMRERGFDDGLIDRFTIENPRKAFGV